MLDITAILEDWEQFLYTVLGAPEKYEMAMALHAMMMGESPEAIMERYPSARALREDPDGAAMASLSRTDLATVSDEDLIAAQDMINHHYGFFLSVEDLVVFMRELLTRINISEVRTVADIGCGPCSYTSFLLSRGLLRAKVKAVDPSLAILMRARVVSEEADTSDSIELIEGWGQYLPVEDSFSDLTLMIDSLEWMSKWQEALCEAARVTSEGGRLFICHSTFSPRRRIDEMKIVKVLSREGMDVKDILHFGAGASATPRILVIATKQEPQGVIVPTDTIDY